MTLCPPKLLKLLGFPVICAAMFAVMGGHWTVLQAVAWSQMVVTYSQDARSLSAGIQKTFSGEFPCDMCRQIAKAKQTESQAPATVKTEKKTETFPPPAATALRPPGAADFRHPAAPPGAFAVRSDAPPQPIPIGVFA